jgi:hypothetical protein
MRTTKLHPVVKLTLATASAGLIPPGIHSFLYSLLSGVAIPIYFLFYAVITYALAFVFVGPVYFWLSHKRKLKAWNTITTASLAGGSLGVLVFALNDWGTGDYTTYGEAGYRLVENGSLTIAGFIFSFLRVIYCAVLGALAGLVVWLFVRSDYQD